MFNLVPKPCFLNNRYDTMSSVKKAYPPFCGGVLPVFWKTGLPSQKVLVPQGERTPAGGLYVEMMGFLGMGNNPMVGATVSVAVAVEEALKG